jgi:hypothetical protein
MEKILIIDTETTNSLDDALVYDCGFIVADYNGTIYSKHSFVNADIFCDKELMSSAYFAEKIPTYWEEIKSGSRTLTSFRNIMWTLRHIMKENNITKVYAYNCRFDYLALATTQRYLTKSKYRYFFPYGIEIWDTMKMAQDVVATKKSYIKFCEENGYMTKHQTPRVQVKAEVLYRFISGNNEFIESHTGLEDVLIEKEIFAYCVKQHKAMRRNLFEK